MLRSRLLTGALALLTVCAAFSYARADAGHDPHRDPQEDPPSTSTSTIGPRSDDSLPEPTPIRERLPATLPALQVSRVISVFGGSVSLAGHSLIVPAGAVTLPTVFTLTLLPGGSIEVELTAALTSLLGRVVDVGADGLRRPVELTLTYGRATNLEDPQQLRIMRIGATGWELLPTRVDAAARQVTTTLDHLSRYVLVAE